MSGIRSPTTAIVFCDKRSTFFFLFFLSIYTVTIRRHATATVRGPVDSLLYFRLFFPFPRPRKGRDLHVNYTFYWHTQPRVLSLLEYLFVCHVSTDSHSPVPPALEQDLAQNNCLEFLKRFCLYLSAILVTLPNYFPVSGPNLYHTR